MRQFYQSASVQLAGQNPKDAWVPPVMDGTVPPFDPFNAPIPGAEGYEVRIHPCTLPTLAIRRSRNQRRPRKG